MKKEEKSTLRIFVGSPGDVEEERKAAFEVIEHLNGHHWRPDNIMVEGYGWDNTHYPKLVNHPPQINIEDGLPKMAEYDICIFILRHRLGTPLDDSFKPLKDEGRQPTGTEYEFYGAVDAGTPRVLLYRRNEDFSLKLGLSQEAMQSALEQLQWVEAFITKQTKECNCFTGDYHKYETTVAFKERLESDLTALVNRLFKKPTTIENPKPDQPEPIPTAYLNWLKKESSNISLLGLDSNETHNVGLPQVHVPAITPTRTTEGEEKLERGGMKRQGHDLLLERLNRDSLYLPGAPGAGKSTFCNWVCQVVTSHSIPSDTHEVADEYQEHLPDDLLGRLPILCRLREFAGHMDCCRDQGDWSRAQLEDALCRWLEVKRPDGLTGELFLDHLKRGNCLLIIDGFDEVPPSDKHNGKVVYPRAALLSGLKRALPHWIESGNRILLTSRPYGLNPAEQKQLSLDERKLAHLTDDLQQLFIRRWFQAADRKEGGNKGEGLLQQLKARADLAELRNNPMLLTALCVKYDQGKRLPKDIHDLYSAVVNQVLHSRYLGQEKEVDGVRRRLGVVAQVMQRGAEVEKPRTLPTAEIPLDEVDQALIAYARSNPQTEGSEAAAVEKREDLLSRSGLLLPAADKKAEFYHLSFQDFLAAERFVRAKESVSKLVEDHAKTPQWRQMLLFLFANLANRDDLESALEAFAVLGEQLDDNSLQESPHPAILLGDCLEIAHARGHLGEWGERYRQACYSALNRVENPEHREALFRALGATELDDRPGVGLDANGVPDIEWCAIPAGEIVLNNKAGTFPVERFHIARYPVTNAQFQAFIDAGEGYMNPRWWAALDAEPEKPATPRWSEANHPRDTVSWYEAMAYCEWLSEQLGYRVNLPTEWQWQQAACSGNPGQNYPWGKKYLSGRANINETVVWDKAGPHNLDRTTAVGLYPLGNSLQGVSDLPGNVWEWCLNEYGKPANAQPSGTKNRVVRGGSWILDSDDARASFRDDLSGPVSRNDLLGFRLSCLSPIMKP
ncbi:MAG: SUMF1/EgtB/PvdO family nonheme iron enzyme [Sedimenticola sp.]